LSGKHPGIQKSNKPNERLFIQQYQNSDIKKVNSWPAGLHLGMQVFASLPNILALLPDAPLAVSSVSELCFETCVNVLGRDVLFARKPNNDHLVVLHPLNEKPESDLAAIIRNRLLM
jgi:hypothetical protein